MVTASAISATSDALAATLAACGPFAPSMISKSHSLSLVQRSEAVLLNRGVVDENVLTPFHLNEAVSFGLTEPLYFALST